MDMKEIREKIASQIKNKQKNNIVLNEDLLPINNNLKEKAISKTVVVQNNKSISPKRRKPTLITIKPAKSIEEELREMRAILKKNQALVNNLNKDSKKLTRYKE